MGSISLEPSKKTRFCCFVFFILFSRLLYSESNIKIRHIENHTKLDFLINYISDNFEFKTYEDSKKFLANQKKWIDVSKQDCNLIYSDIGSHSSFIVYYQSCINELYDIRYKFLLDNYLCKISKISSEICDEEKKFIDIFNKNKNLINDSLKE